jgi:hypothetical protein
MARAAEEEAAGEGGVDRPRRPRRDDMGDDDVAGDNA